MALRPVPPPTIRVPRSAYWRRLFAAVDKIAGPLQRAIVRIVREHQPNLSETRLAGLIRLGNFGQLDRELDLGGLWVKISEELERRQTQALTYAAQEELRDITTLELSFAVENPMVLAAFKAERFELIRDLDRGTRDAVRASLGNWKRFAREVDREAIRGGLMAGYRSYGVNTAVRDIRNAVGLTRRDAIAVQNFRRGMIAANRGEMSLKGVRNRWTAARSVRSANAWKDLPTIERHVERYANRLLRDRAESIARTEMHRAMSTARHETWKRMAAEGIGTDKVVRWMVSPDERTCPICLPLHNYEVELGESFPGVGDRPPAHVRCRCTTVRVKPKSSNRFKEGTDTRVRELQEAAGVDPAP